MSTFFARVILLTERTDRWTTLQGAVVVVSMEHVHTLEDSSTSLPVV